MGEVLSAVYNAGDWGGDEAREAGIGGLILPLRFPSKVLRVKLGVFLDHRKAFIVRSSALLRAYLASGLIRSGSRLGRSKSQTTIRPVSQPIELGNRQTPACPLLGAAQPGARMQLRPPRGGNAVQVELPGDRTKRVPPPPLLLCTANSQRLPRPVVSLPPAVRFNYQSHISRVRKAFT